MARLVKVSAPLRTGVVRKNAEHKCDSDNCRWCADTGGARGRMVGGARCGIGVPLGTPPRDQVPCRCVVFFCSCLLVVCLPYTGVSHATWSCVHTCAHHLVTGVSMRHFEMVVDKMEKCNTWKEVSNWQVRERACWLAGGASKLSGAACGR